MLNRIEPIDLVTPVTPTTPVGGVCAVVATAWTRPVSASGPGGLTVVGCPPVPTGDRHRTDAVPAQRAIEVTTVLLNGLPAPEGNIQVA